MNRCWMDSCIGAEGARRRAFSLAELMIALVILGFGLLIVGAALPVGLDYTKRSVEISAGEAAAANALSEIAQQIRLSSNPDHDNLIRPRLAAGPNTVDITYEPQIKVRPLIFLNIPATAQNAGGGGIGGAESYTQRVNRERNLRDNNYYLTEFDYVGAVESAIGGTSGWFPGASTFECNLPGTGRILHAVGSSLACVYPQPKSNRPYRVRPSSSFEEGFFPAGNMGQNWVPNSTATQFAEAEKARGARTFWVGFYRRVSYDDGGPDRTIVGAPPNPTDPANADNVAGDPATYEFLAVACRVPDRGYRFMASRYVSAATPTPDMSEAFGIDGLLPMPVLTVFDTLPTFSGLIVGPGNTTQPYPGGTGPDGIAESGDEIPAAHQDFPNLKFQCTYRIGRMLPPGSIFIPAVNDAYPSLTASRVRVAGLFPYSPKLMPVFEVVDRIEDLTGNGADTTIVVKNNGVYPWVSPTVPPNLQASKWPVWVIPPAFKVRDGTATNVPVFDNHSPVISTARRVIRLPEVP